MKINDDGLNLIKTYEGFRSKAYLCPAGVPTIGYGTTEYPDGRRVSLGDKDISEKDATTYLKLFITTLEYEIQKMVSVPLNQNQFSALVSFTYNLGLGSLRKSTLLKVLNEGNYQAAADEFLKWNKAGGKELPGLTKRREAERTLFLKSGQLPDGPSTDDINKKLSEVEKKTFVQAPSLSPKPS